MEDSQSTENSSAGLEDPCLREVGLDLSGSLEEDGSHRYLTAVLISGVAGGGPRAIDNFLQLSLLIFKWEKDAICSSFFFCNDQTSQVNRGLGNRVK